MRPGGGGEPPSPWDGRATRRERVVLGAAAALAAVFGLPVLYGFVVLGGAAEPGTTAAGLAVALLTAALHVAIAVPFLRLARPSTGVLAFAVLCGMASIALHTSLTELIPLSLVPFRDGIVFEAGVMEEVGKGLFLLLFALASLRYFPNAFAGLVLGWFVGIGFAFLENISYDRAILDAEAYVGLALRTAAAILNDHPLDTGLAGAAMGWLLPKHGARALWWVWPLALLPGMALHILNDTDGFPAGLALGGATLAVLLMVAMRRHRA